MAAVLFCVLIAWSSLTIAADGTSCDDYADEHLYLPEGARDGESSPVYVAFNWHLVGSWDGWWYRYMPWLFHESNGEPGLQRADDYCIDQRPDGTWYTPETADSSFF